MTENNSDSNKYYEIGFVLAPTLEEANAQTVSKEIEAAVGRAGGTVVDGEGPRLRRLAYPIYKIIGGQKIAATTGFFGWTKFSIESDGAGERVAKLEQELKKINEILRFLLIKTVKEKTYTPRAPEVEEEILAPESMPDETSEESNGQTASTDSREGDVVEKEKEE